MLRLNSKTFPEFQRRFNAIRADTPRRWGKLSAPDMMLHLSGVTQLSLGERPYTMIGNIFTYTVGKYLIFYVLPWPKGVIKVPPEWTPASQESLDAERARLFGLMERFVADAEREPNKIATHPMFGKCPLHFWTRIHAKHFNHHLCQFGV